MLRRRRDTKPRPEETPAPIPSELLPAPSGPYIPSVLQLGKTVLPEPLPTPELLSVASALPFQAVREHLARPEAFGQVDDSPWPTATIRKSGSRGLIQLRPAAIDEQPLQAPEALDVLVRRMWEQRSELSPLSVDALDALSAVWLQHAGHPDDPVIVDVDTLLEMRGLKPKESGSGRRGGFEAEQRQAMLQALAHVQNVWVTLADVDVYEETPAGRRRKTKQAIQSRPFVITDRMGQVRLDGYMDVQRFIFRPGTLFARFLWGPGRQTALMSAKALEYDPYRQAPEKALTRYLSWVWRSQASAGVGIGRYRVDTILEACAIEPDTHRPARTRDRLEKALETLHHDGVVAGWQYERWDEAVTRRRGWLGDWLGTILLIEAPDTIREHYDAIGPRSPARPPAKGAPAGASDLGARLKAARKVRQLTQMQAAEAAGVSQALFSQAERGKTLSPATRKALETWLRTVSSEPPRDPPRHEDS